MKVCLLGECSDVLDEGMRKAAFFFKEYLSENHEVVLLDVHAVLSKTFWKTLREFNPQILHYVPGPSIKSFLMLKTVSVHYRKTKTVMSAMHPLLYPFYEGVIRLVKPDLILVQSRQTEQWFKNIGCRTKFLPCGVEIDRFVPSTRRMKQEFRKKYGLELDRFLVLHVGPIKGERNVQMLIKLQERQNQVVIVGAKSTGVQKRLVWQLRKSGCIVLMDYFPHIEEIYSLSDCYVFPTLLRKDFKGRFAASSIEMPLSVLEAMSCNLPVVSTRFGALPRVFDEGDGLIYADDEETMISALERIRTGIEVKTRQKVLAYSWKGVVKDLAEIYASMLLGS